MRRFVLALALATTASAAQAQTEAPAETATAIVAGGCFWCVEADFDKVEGVLETVSGYTGGTVENPTYEQVSSDTTGHYEAVEITYDPSVISYEDILETFWRTVDPTDAGGQFCDRGDSYRTAVFVQDPEEREIAEATLAEAEQALGQEIVTPILEAGAFYRAEEYHQDYYNKQAFNYGFYRRACGRDARVQSLWGDEAFLNLDKG
jgi:peptide-methionine (S)-S-oxide reductase